MAFERWWLHERYSTGSTGGSRSVWDTFAALVSQKMRNEVLQVECAYVAFSGNGILPVGVFVIFDEATKARSEDSIRVLVA